MAVKFLDGITVNSGSSSVATIIAEGTRPVTITGGAIGSITIGGSNGGWATGYLFKGYSGTNRGGFGALGSVDTVSYFYIGDAWNDTTMIVQPNAGSVGIGTTSPSDGDLTIGTPKLHVATAGTSGTFNLAARFQSTTTDADNTGTSILINSLNDRGLLIKAGRKDGDREVAYFDVVNSGGNTTNMLTMGKFNSAYNVGIGTTTPSAKLHVKESTSATYAAYIENTIAGGDYLAMIGDAGDNVFEFLSSGTGGEAEMKMYSDGVLKADINADGNSYFNGGNVGIGATAPAEKLEVAGKIKATGTADVLQLYRNSSSQANYIKFYDNATSLSEFYLGYTSNNKDFQISNLASNGTIALRSGGANTMMLNSSQNVGIGTTSPGEKLEVIGTAKATSVRATGGGDGGLVLRQWTYASNYASLATNGMSGLEYCMISDGTNTFVGAGTGGNLRLRGPANDSSPQIELNGSLCKVDAGDFKVEDGSIAVGNITNSTTDGRIDASNDIVAYSTSDIRLKDNIKSIDKALDKVNSIQGIEFDWIEKEEVHGNSGHDIGVIAQEIEKILPDVVTTRDNGYKAVKYEKIVPLLIEAIKDLSKQVDGLKRLI